jgi:hypothetical protein
MDIFTNVFASVSLKMKATTDKDEGDADNDWQ